MIKNQTKSDLLLVAWLCLTLSCSMRASPPQNFQEAKKAAHLIWLEHPKTFYCGCRYDKRGLIDFKSCEYRPSDYRKNKVIGWEHVVPVSWYGRKRDCWSRIPCISRSGKRLSGRKCCQKKDRQFRRMEADLHNLVPVVREINLARKNYRFAELPLEQKSAFYYRDCPIIIDKRYHIVEPADRIKGMVARIHFYMAGKYNIELSEQQKKLYTEWDQRFPPLEWEKRWNEQVAAISQEERSD